MKDSNNKTNQDGRANNIEPASQNVDVDSLGGELSPEKAKKLDEYIEYTRSYEQG